MVAPIIKVSGQGRRERENKGGFWFAHRGLSAALWYLIPPGVLRSSVDHQGELQVDRIVAKPDR